MHDGNDDDNGVVQHGGHTPNNGLTETSGLGLLCTVPLRRNLTGNANANGCRTDTERVREREQNRYRMDTERISNGYGTVMDQKKKKKRSGTQTIRELVLQNTW